MRRFQYIIFFSLLVLPMIACSARSNYKDTVTGIEFVFVKGGCFPMGDTFDGNNDYPVHNECVSDFYISKYKVTPKQWLILFGLEKEVWRDGKKVTVMESTVGKNELYSKNEIDSYDSVSYKSWNDAQEYVNKLNSVTKGKYRLATNIEWEYACRSGGKAQRYAGANKEEELRTPKKIDGVYDRPNDLGIYDMSGGMNMEWVQDLWVQDVSIQEVWVQDNKVVLNPIQREEQWAGLRGGLRSNVYLSQCARKQASKVDNQTYTFRLVREP